MSRVFLDVKIGHTAQPRRMIFELFAQDAPKCSENFKCLCTGEKGVASKSGKDLHFKGSIFHRVIPGFMAQGGDFTNFDGTGGESIYGPKFNDEAFIHKHTERGLLSMANAGKNTNGSQFFMTFGPAPHLNGKHVVFGKLIDGLDVLGDIERVQTDRSDKPKTEIRIMNCGAVTSPTLTGPSGSSIEVTGGKKENKKDVGLPLRFGKKANPAVLIPSSSSSSSLASSLSPSAAAEPASDFTDAGVATLEGQSTEEADAHDSRRAAASNANVPVEDTTEALPDMAPDLSKMDSRQRKLYELKMKLQQGRKENRKEVSEEYKRFTDKDKKSKREDNVDLTDKERKRREKHAEQQKDIQHKPRDETLQNIYRDTEEKAIDPKFMFLHEPADMAHKRKSKTTEKAAAKAGFGWDKYNQDRIYDHMEKRVASVQQTVNREVVDINDVSSYGGKGFQPTEAQLDNMVQELADSKARSLAAAAKKRRPYSEGEDHLYINDFNRNFNKKLKTAYDKYTTDIAQSLERGTAL